MTTSLEKMKTLLETATAASVVSEELAGPFDEGPEPKNIRRDVEFQYARIELKDAIEKLDRLNFDRLQRALIDCIQDYAGAYQAQQSYTLEAFANLPLSLTSINRLVVLLEVKLRQYRLALPNGLQNFYTSATELIRNRLHEPRRKTRTEVMAELED